MSCDDVPMAKPNQYLYLNINKQTNTFFLNISKQNEVRELNFSLISQNILFAKEVAVKFAEWRTAQAYTQAT